MSALQAGVWPLINIRRNELTERPFAAFDNHAAFKRGVGHLRRHPLLVGGEQATIDAATLISHIIA